METRSQSSTGPRPGRAVIFTRTRAAAGHSRAAVSRTHWQAKEPCLALLFHLFWVGVVRVGFALFYHANTIVQKFIEMIGRMSELIPFDTQQFYIFFNYLLEFGVLLSWICV